jgi:hypothetical protein
MVAVNIVIKSIRRLMGWCPNAKALETQHSICPEYLEANSQSRGKDARNSPISSPSWWNKRHNRVLIMSSVLTLFSIYLIIFQEVRPMDKGFMFGLIIGTIFNLLFCIWSWHYLDNIKNSSRKIKIITVSSEWRAINLILSLALLYLLFSPLNWGFILFLISVFSLIALLCYFKFDLSPLILLFYFGSRNMALISGLCLTAYLYYLTDIYWEKKNKKIVLIYGRNMPEIHIANMGTE